MLVTDETTMMFGQHAGKRMVDVPASYLLWAADQKWLREDLREYIERNRNALEMEVEEDGR